ncbi:hypothetical protein ACFQFQ_25235 [Sulfitobacter porphyrae]|uniref:Uncharacterized protein n=1 Tax=Sulfitobacter porphyrae TaxID=1246864 RepID=A0ABW2B8J8_9RHOB
MTKLTFNAAGLSLALCLGASTVFAQAINGSDLTLSGDITQNGFGPNFLVPVTTLLTGAPASGLHVTAPNPLNRVRCG